jgi:hypothetical protein
VHGRPACRQANAVDVAARRSCHDAEEMGERRRNRFHLLQLALLKEPAVEMSFEMVPVVFVLERLIKAFDLVNIFAQ